VCRTNTKREQVSRVENSERESEERANHTTIPPFANAWGKAKIPTPTKDLNKFWKAENVEPRTEEAP
jgi:hypothetical protein